MLQLIRSWPLPRCSLVRSISYPEQLLPTCTLQLTAHCLHSSSAVAAPVNGNAGPGATRDRSYPSEPRVGVGAVVFRPNSQSGCPEVLMIRRAKEPSKGMWCFPGGSLELGETIADCAVREVKEETGIDLRNHPDASAEGFSNSLTFPTAFAAYDLVEKAADGRVKFHYAIIEVAAVAADLAQQPSPSDDVDAAMWVPADQLQQLPNLTNSCNRFVKEAMRIFNWQETLSNSH